jgi:hypothetical protein
MKNEAESIFVDDDIKIYISGAMLAPNPGFYWNTEMGKPIVFSSEIYGMSVSNGDIYLLDVNGNIYKNDFKNPLYNIGTDASSLFIQDGDIYALRTTSGSFSYNINGAQYSLSNSCTAITLKSKIFVYKKTVYSAGATTGGAPVACYWVNQEQKTLELSSSGGYAYAMDIKVVKRR